MLPAVTMPNARSDSRSWMGKSRTPTSAAEKPAAAKRPQWTTSKVKGSPEPPAPYRTDVVFPRVKFFEPLEVTAAAGTDRLFVAERPGKVFSFVRDKDGDRIFAVFNLSGDKQRVTFKENLHHGRYKDFETGRAVTVDAATQLQLAPWSYRLLTIEN